MSILYLLNIVKKFNTQPNKSNKDFNKTNFEIILSWNSNNDTRNAKKIEI